jgi:Fe-S cluster assembly iron-binding protein IscA
VEPFATPIQEAPMLTVTERAVEFLRESLGRRQEGMPESLRIVYSEREGYHLTLDNPKDGDHVFQQDGERFLLLDAELTELLAEAIVDIQDSPQGPRLTLTTNKTPEATEPAEGEGEAGESEAPAGEAEAAGGKKGKGKAKAEDAS